LLKTLYRSPALRVTAAFAVGGLAFTVGNLILARVMPSAEYGLVSLVIGIVSVGTYIAPLGIDLVVPRRGLSLGPALRRAAALTSALVALTATALAAAVYHLEWGLLACVLVATTAAGIVQVTTAHFQSQHRFGISVPLLQASNWALVPVGLITALVGTGGAFLPSALLALIGLLTAAIGWGLVMVDGRGAPRSGLPSRLWREAVPLMAVHSASACFLQLERLVIAPTVGFNELAVFGVLASLVGSPYRMLQAAVGFTLIPRLRQAASIEARAQLVWREALVVVAAMAGGSVLIWLLAPFVAHELLGGRYDLTDALMLATIVSGVLKVFSAFATAAASALASERRLTVLSIASWACIGIATLASFAAARWGLVGVLYAISAGWLLRCLVASWIALPHLRAPTFSGSQIPGDR
jgi:O-antigen/teichoic acid export membrane protein